MKTCGMKFGLHSCLWDMGFCMYEDRVSSCPLRRLLAACHRQRDRSRRAEKLVNYWDERYTEAQEKIMELSQRIEQLESDLMWAKRCAKFGGNND